MDILGSPVFLYGTLMVFINSFNIKITSVLSNLLFLVNLNMYTIVEYSKINMILNKLDIKFNRFVEMFPVGYFYKNGICGFSEYDLNADKHCKKLSIICSTKNYNELINNNDDEHNKSQIIFVEQLDSNDYSMRGLLFREEIMPKPNQQRCIEQIVETYNKKKKCVCILYGEPGSGKTTVPYLLSRSFNKNNKLTPSIVSNYNPLIDKSFNYVYNTVTSSFESPLIVIIDETDIIIDEITSKKTQTPTAKEKVVVFIHDKKTWNTWLDNLDFGIYPNLIVIMTTNKNPSDITSDSSLLREGRIDLKLKC